MLTRACNGRHLKSLLKKMSTNKKFGDANYERRKNTTTNRTAIQKSKETNKNLLTMHGCLGSFSLICAILRWILIFLLSKFCDYFFFVIDEAPVFFVNNVSFVVTFYRRQRFGPFEHVIHSWLSYFESGRVVLMFLFRLFSKRDEEYPISNFGPCNKFAWFDGL